MKNRWLFRLPVKDISYPVKDRASYHKYPYHLLAEDLPLCPFGIKGVYVTLNDVQVDIWSFLNHYCVLMWVLRPKSTQNLMKKYSEHHLAYMSLGGGTNHINLQIWKLWSIANKPSFHPGVLNTVRKLFKKQVRNNVQCHSGRQTLFERQNPGWKFLKSPANLLSSEIELWS